MDEVEDLTPNPDKSEAVVFYSLLKPLFTEHGIDIGNVDQVNAWKDANKPTILRYVNDQIDEAAATFPEWVRQRADGTDGTGIDWTYWHVYPALEVLASLVDQLRSYNNVADDLAPKLADCYDDLSVVEVRIALRSALELAPPKLLWTLPNPLQTLIDTIEGVAFFIDDIAREPAGWAYRTWIATYDRKQTARSSNPAH